MEIDHIDGSSADLGNLQLLCADYHHTKTAESLVPASAEQSALFMTRVAPDIPRLLADDKVTWQTSWSGLKSSRKARFVDSLKTAGIDLSGLETRAQMIAARETQVPMPSPRPQEYDEADYGSNFLADATERSA
ncbi:HNH endonuclease signature motif containing protein [Labedella gwakjiensis]|nr:HNH endonuclease signature motif containing protein [Labedella gwakjiensis]RUQ85529.1 HNH endonuclease [Labedella gwakjiensis]